MIKLTSVIVLVLLLLGIVYGFPLRRENSLMRGLRYREGISYQQHQHQLQQQNHHSKHALKADAAPQPQWFKQNVDHFNPLNTDTFNQQYFVNDTYWQPGGPVFIVLGGEGPLSSSYVTGHFIVNTYAQQFNALIVAVEHRFYGKSSPTKDLSTKNLYLLTTQQALADYANFRNFIAKSYNTGDSKWISFGGSYSGSLSAWFRLKYPQLIDGAIATSAPVKPQLDFPEYFEVVADSIGPQCSAFVQGITTQVTQMLQNNRSAVESIFNTCDPIVSDLDVATFMESLSGGVSEIVQYNNDNNKYTMMNVTTMCALFDQGSDPLATYAAFNNQYNTFSGANCTTSSYQSMIEQLQDTTVNGENAASRLWTFQTCIEYGYFQTGESANQPFSNTITLDYFVNQCTDIFGPPGYKYSPAIEWIETEYGAKNIQTSQTIFLNGLVDPWHILGITNATSSEIQTFVIPPGAHCSDFYPPLPTDPPSLTEARKMEVDLISSIVFS